MNKLRYRYSSSNRKAQSQGIRHQASGIRHQTSGIRHQTSVQYKAERRIMRSHRHSRTLLAVMLVLVTVEQSLILICSAFPLRVPSRSLAVSRNPSSFLKLSKEANNSVGEPTQSTGQPSNQPTSQPTSQPTN